jgi:hypothetical protein
MRAAAIRAASGQVVAITASDATRTPSVAIRRNAGPWRTTLPIRTPSARASASRSARAASGLDSTVPARSNSTADASLPTSAGCIRSTRSASSTGVVRRRHAGRIRRLARITTVATSAASAAIRIALGKRTAASTSESATTSAQADAATPQTVDATPSVQTRLDDDTRARDRRDLGAFDARDPRRAASVAAVA